MSETKTENRKIAEEIVRDWCRRQTKDGGANLEWLKDAIEAALNERPKVEVGEDVKVISYLIVQLLGGEK